MLHSVGSFFKDTYIYVHNWNWPTILLLFTVLLQFLSEGYINFIRWIVELFFFFFFTSAPNSLYWLEMIGFLKIWQNLIKYFGISDYIRMFYCRFNFQ